MSSHEFESAAVIMETTEEAELIPIKGNFLLIGLNLFLIALVLVIFGFWYVHPTNEFDVTEIINLGHPQGQITFHTSGDMVWNGLKWEVNLEGKFATDNDTRVLEMSQDTIDRAIGDIAACHEHIQKGGGRGRLYNVYKCARELPDYLRWFLLLSIRVDLERDNQVHRAEYNNWPIPSRPNPVQWLNVSNVPDATTGEFQYKSSFHLTTFNNSLFSNVIPDPTVIVIPRVLRNWSLYDLLTPLIWEALWNALKGRCIWFEHSVKTDYNFIPEATISILFCYGA